MPVPITLEELIRVVFLFEPQELRELGIARQHLVASRVPVVGGRRGSGRIIPEITSWIEQNLKDYR